MQHSIKRQLITKVDKLMGKMLTIKNAAILRQAGCKEKACRKNDTRWSSIFVLLEKFLRLYPYILYNNYKYTQVHSFYRAFLSLQYLYLVICYLATSTSKYFQQIIANFLFTSQNTKYLDIKFINRILHWQCTFI